MPVVPLMIATKLPPLRLGRTMFFVTGFQPKPRWELSVVTYGLLPGASHPFEPNVVSAVSVWAFAFEHQLPESDNTATPAASRQAVRIGVTE